MQVFPSVATMVAIVLFSDMAQVVLARNDQWDNACIRVKRQCKSPKQDDKDHAYWDCMCRHWTGEIGGGEQNDCQAGCVADISSGVGALTAWQAPRLCENYCSGKLVCDTSGINPC